MIVKEVVRRIIGEAYTGMLDYWRFPELNERDILPFNGQEFRKKIFKELLNSFSFDAIVETGSYLGSTTSYLHEISGLPVYTVEINPRWYGYVNARFLWDQKVKPKKGDTRAFLKKLAAKQRMTGKKIFFYLDAHWRKELPLKEEIEIIFDTWPDSIIMIDDFQVPDDPDYGYDDYGEGKTLNMNYLSSVTKHKLTALFPTKEGKMETGRKRGCVVVGSSDEIVQRLEKMKTLRKYSS